MAIVLNPDGSKRRKCVTCGKVKRMAGNVIRCKACELARIRKTGRRVD